jgi:hypothetical protein
MAKGQRAHVGYQTPVSSADILPKNKQVPDAPPAIFQCDVSPEELDHNVEKVPFIHLMTTYLSYVVLIVIGHIRDVVIRIYNPKKFSNFTVKNGYAPITTGFGIWLLIYRYILSS